MCISFTMFIPALFYLNSHSYFQQLISNWDLAFLISPLDSNWDFWILVLGSTSDFLLIQIEIFQCCSSWNSQFFSIHERDGKLGFSFISLGRFYFQSSQFTEKLENWDFWITLSFIFCHIVILSGICKRTGTNLWWNCQFSSKEMFIFMQHFCISLSAGNTVFKLKWG